LKVGLQCRHFERYIKLKIYRCEVAQTASRVYAVH